MALANLLRAVVSLGHAVPVVASPSFAAWGGDDVLTSPVDVNPSGIWLLDSRDQVAQQQLELLHQRGSPGPDVMVILARSDEYRRSMKDMLRSFRKSSSHRLSEARVRSLLERTPGSVTHRLAFDDGRMMPTSFHCAARSPRSGSALLVSRISPLDNALWSLVRERLAVDQLRVSSVQLRDRGSAIVIVEADRGRYVVRVVPAGDLQNLVRRNYSILTDLRGRVSKSCLALMPEPHFAIAHDGVLVMAESYRPGVLAWRLTDIQRRARTYKDALEFLDHIKLGTRQLVPRGSSQLGELLAEDRDVLKESDFVSDLVRREVLREINGAESVLSKQELVAHASHGDFGYGNLLVDPATGALQGVIDWDTAKLLDLPGIDRVNLEIQILHGGRPRIPLPDAIRRVWRERRAHDGLEESGGPAQVRALFGLGVCRYVTRTLRYPEIYRRLEQRFERALSWLSTVSAT